MTNTRSAAEEDEGRPPTAGHETASVGAARIENVGFLIADVTRLMRKGFDRRVRSLGLTRPQWRVLVYVLENEGLSQSVRRVRSSADQREWLIYGGEDSRDIMPQLVEAAGWLRGVYFQGLTRSEEQMLRRLLERMRSNLSYELER